MGTTGITEMNWNDSSFLLVKRFKDWTHMSFVKQSLASAALSIALVCAFAMPASAQELKIGVVNVPLLMDRAPQTKAAMDALQEEFAPRQREFAASAKKLEDLTAKVQKDAAVMGEAERRTAEKDLRDLQREVARLQNEFQEAGLRSRSGRRRVVREYGCEYYGRSAADHRNKLQRYQQTLNADADQPGRTGNPVWLRPRWRS